MRIFDVLKVQGWTVTEGDNGELTLFKQVTFKRDIEFKTTKETILQDVNEESIHFLLKSTYENDPLYKAMNSLYFALLHNEEQRYEDYYRQAYMSGVYTKLDLEDMISDWEQDEQFLIKQRDPDIVIANIRLTALKTLVNELNSLSNVS
jgi:hypothetical protein